MFNYVSLESQHQLHEQGVIVHIDTVAVPYGWLVAYAVCEAHRSSRYQIFAVSAISLDILQDIERQLAVFAAARTARELGTLLGLSVSSESIVTDLFRRQLRQLR